MKSSTKQHIIANVILSILYFIIIVIGSFLVTETKQDSVPQNTEVESVETQENSNAEIS